MATKNNLFWSFNLEKENNTIVHNFTEKSAMLVLIFKAPPNDSLPNNFPTVDRKQMFLLFLLSEKQ